MVKKIKKTSLLKTSKALSLYAAKLAIDKKGFNVSLLDIQRQKSLMDYILIISAQSTRHAQSLAEYIIMMLKKEQIHCFGSEGLKDGKWILLDYNDIIIHIFFEYVRDVYDLESFLQEGTKIRIPKSYYQ